VLSGPPQTPDAQLQQVQRKPGRQHPVFLSSSNVAGNWCQKHNQYLFSNPVIWDQAGFHPDPQLQAVPARIHLVPLPPYSPELNPVEAIGDVIKDRIANTLWKTLDDLEAAIGEELKPIYETAERVRSLVSHGWLVDQVNATATENSAITC
jgi:hypothetical protein